MATSAVASPDLAGDRRLPALIVAGVLSALYACHVAFVYTCYGPPDKLSIAYDVLDVSLAAAGLCWAWTRSYRHRLSDLLASTGGQAASYTTLALVIGNGGVQRLL